jgi:cupin fold WbuC family metalloprotein
MTQVCNIIHVANLADLSEQAKASPRLRKNLNFHVSDTALCHRLLNALEPGTYIQPHCHLDPEKAETMIILAGSIGLLIFAADGSVTQQVTLAAGRENLGITIPAGVFHSMVALESGSVFFESKAGPYVALSVAEKAGWAPAEGDPGSSEFLAEMCARF